MTSDCSAVPAGTGIGRVFRNREGPHAMRVVVNQLPALGIKTGIGHYTVQLLRCLREQAGADEIDGFPEGWVARLRESCARLRPYLDGSGQGLSPTQVEPARRSRRGRILYYAREMGRAC